MAPHVCPWWGGYFIDNRFRRLLDDRPLVRLSRAALLSKQEKHGQSQ